MTVRGRAPIAIALDAPDIDTARGWASAVAPSASAVKVGLELFDRYGQDGVRAVRAAAPDLDLFLDVKLHDIPATVRGAARSLASLEPAYLTVHCLGGSAMIRAAAEALSATRVTGVTVLTSLGEGDLAALGLLGPARDAARRLAAVAVAAGARAIVCSPLEVAAVRAEVGADVHLVTPGVRPADAGHDDQARVSTPEQALADGADLLVIGRPVTAAPDPAQAAAALASMLSRVAFR